MPQQFDAGSAVYGVSFVDITATGATRGEGLERNQQRNWDTVLQIFGLLTQPIVFELPQVYSYNQDDKFIGSELFKRLGKRHQFVIEMLRPDTRFWMFAIGSESVDVITVQKLNELFDYIPVISGLRETIQLEPSVFQTQDSELINIQFFPAPVIR